MTALVDLVGQRFGRLVVQSLASRKPIKWMCLCDCGRLKAIARSALRKGKGRTSTLSCGCIQREITTRRLSTHGLSWRQEYSAWRAMKRRCTQPKSPNWKDYGGRGISVCEAWRSSFAAFIADMGQRPSAAYSIERRNVNGNYEPSNCYWATAGEQANNKRNNVFIETSSGRMTASAAARAAGVSVRTIMGRVARDAGREAILLPVEKRGMRKLSHDDIERIRADDRPIRVIAISHGIDRGTVRRIRLGR